MFASCVKTFDGICQSKIIINSLQLFEKKMERGAEIVSAYTTVLSCCNLLLQRERDKRRKRRWWMVSLNRSRQVYSGSDMLMDLVKETSGKFENFCRMSSADFSYFLNKIGYNITKQNTNMRPAIPAADRLAVTLRYLPTGDSFASLGYLFKISHQSISNINPDVCKALNEALKGEIRLPQSEGEWKRLENGFCQRWNFAYCVGAIDGKHVLLQAPFNSESTFYNYKKTFSVVLLALVDADYCFTFVDVGAEGRMNDAGVFACTSLYRQMMRGQLLLPSSEPLPGREKSVPWRQLLPGTWRQYTGNTSLIPFSKTAREPSQEARDVRNEFAQYFITTGAVEWQDYIN